MRKLIALSMVMVAASVFADARTISFDYAEPGCGAVKLNFGAGSATNYLYALHDSADRGDDYRAWADMKRIAAIAPDMDSYVWKIPAEWRINAGDTVRFALAADFPYDQIIDSVRGSCTAYVDSGIVPDATTRVVTEYRFDGNYAVLFGLEGSPAFYIQWMNNGDLKAHYAYFGASKKTPYADTNVQDGGWHVLDLGYGGVVYDGVQYEEAFTGMAGTAEYTLPIFCRKTSTGAIQTGKAGASSIRSMQIYKGGVLVRDFRPCMKNGEAGLFDAVSKTVFFKAAGCSGNLVGGTSGACGPYDPFPIDCASDVSYSATVATSIRSMTLTAYDEATGTASLAFGAGAVKQLFAVQDHEGDKGLLPSAWSNAVYVADIASGTTSYQYELPAAWRAQTGAVRFFLADPDTLPNGYTRYSYLRSNGAPYIDTGFIPDKNTTVRAYFCAAEGNAAYGNAGNFVGFTNGGTTGTFGIFMGLSYNPPLSTLPNNIFTSFRWQQMGPAGWFIDGRRVPGTEAWYDAPGVTITKTMVIFGRRDEAGTRSKTGAASVSALFIYDNGRLVRSFVPCSNGSAYGMYDRVTQQFFDNAGDGEFTVGSVVTTPDLLDDAQKSATEAIRLVRKVEVASVAKKDGVYTAKFSGADGAFALFVAGDDADRGTDPADWRAIRYLGRIPAGTTVKADTLPDDFAKTNKTLRFFTMAMDPMPFDYRVDIQATGGSAWYQLEDDKALNGTTTYKVKVDTLTEVEVEARLQQDSDPYGAAQFLYNQNSAGMITVTNFGFRAQIKDELFTKPYGSTPRWHKSVFGPDGFFVNGQMLIDGSWIKRETYAEGGAFWLFRSSSRLNGGNGACAIRSAVLRKNGQVVREYIPCVKDGDTKLYDTVTGRFYSWSHNGTAQIWSEGGEVADRPLVATALTACSDAVEPCAGFMVIFR